MKTQDYLYAVSALRVSEESLLKESDLEQLINAPDYKKAIALLTEKGYEKPDGNDFSKMLDNRLSEVWDRVVKSAPEAKSLNMLIIKNDFQNLKAIIKSEVIKSLNERKCSWLILVGYGYENSAVVCNIHT